MKPVLTRFFFCVFFGCSLLHAGTEENPPPSNALCEERSAEALLVEPEIQIGLPRRHEIPESLAKTGFALTGLLANELMTSYFRDELGIRNYLTEHGSNFIAGLSYLSIFLLVSEDPLKSIKNRYPRAHMMAWMLAAFLFNLRIEYKAEYATYDYHDVFMGTLAILATPYVQRTLESLARAMADRRERQYARALAREAVAAASEIYYAEK